VPAPGRTKTGASAAKPMQLPPAVDIRLDQTVREFWFERVEQHTKDQYAGVAISKFPEDLRVYEHLLWLSKPNVVIEVGTQQGGSALWFRDRLLTLATYQGASSDAPLVISIDIELETARTSLAAADPDYQRTIHLVEGDVREPAVAEEVERRLPPGARCLVIEDSLHEYDTTLASLRAFAKLVPVGGFFVVEDGSVDVEAMRLGPEWPRGVLPAVRDWLTSTEGSQFVVREGLELYGMTCHPQGFLQRVGDEEQARDTTFDFPEQRLLSTQGITIRQALHQKETAEERTRAAEHELREVRAALADTEKELLELRDRRSTALSELERQTYWLQRADIDLDAWMRRRPLRLAFHALRAVLRLRRIFNKKRPSG
jgi:cephalosporin hydroxylase